MSLVNRLSVVVHSLFSILRIIVYSVVPFSIFGYVVSWGFILSILQIIIRIVLSSFLINYQSTAALSSLSRAFG